MASTRDAGVGRGGLCLLQPLSGLRSHQSGRHGDHSRCRDRVLNRELAVKVPRAKYVGVPGFLERFKEEAQIASQLMHPGIAPVHELGTLPDGRPYFTMKLIGGRDLAALLHERPSPAQDLPRFLTIFQQICQTVAYAHSKNVLHRDLKPLNIRVGDFGEVQVMDWGLGKVLSGEVSLLERPLLGRNRTRKRSLRRCWKW